MTPTLSPNTQAILLLTAPLIAGSGISSPDLLSPGEYKRLARHLHGMKFQPADLLYPDAEELLRACNNVIKQSRLQRLLGRGFLLSQVIERWQTRAIWVVSRADAAYPRRLKVRLREGAPAVLYGCGDIRLLESGGLAVVGSRHVDDVLIDYTIEVGRLAARSKRTIISGGAKGIDQAAMRGALEEGGRVCGILADSLEKKVMNREHRKLLMYGQLVLISPYDPSSGFNVGNAMQRNKVIYALADAALVVSADFNKGGTWAGATEQLDKLRLIPIYIRSASPLSKGLDALQKKGALSWPDPQDSDAFEAVINLAMPTATDAVQPDLVLLSNDGTSLPIRDATAEFEQKQSFPKIEEVPLPQVSAVTKSRYKEGTIQVSKESEGMSSNYNTVTQTIPNPADVLLAKVSEVMEQILKVPMKESDVAVTLNVSTVQARAWLQYLVEEGLLEKLNKPVRYVVRSQLKLLNNDLLSNLGKER